MFSSLDSSRRRRTPITRCLRIVTTLSVGGLDQQIYLTDYDNLQMENVVYFLAELGIMHYNTSIMYCPSMIAASAVYAARCTLKKAPAWDDTLKLHTGFSEPQLMYVNSMSWLKLKKTLFAAHIYNNFGLFVFSFELKQ